MLTITTPPTGSPVTVASVKSVLHLNVTTDDTDIGNWIAAGAEMFERYTGLTLLQTSYLYSRDIYDRVIRLPRRPVTAVTSVMYRDKAGDWITVSSSDYTLDGERVLMPNVSDSIFPVMSGDVWQSGGSVVKIAFTAGGNVNSISPLAAAGIRAQVAYWYKNRFSYGEQLHPMPGHWEAICETFRAFR